LTLFDLFAPKRNYADNLKIRRLSEPFVGELSGELETLETKKICLSAF
jgi:hypothetical protein